MCRFIKKRPCEKKEEFVVVKASMVGASLLDAAIVVVVGCSVHVHSTIVRLEVEVVVVVGDAGLRSAVDQ